MTPFAVLSSLSSGYVVGPAGEGYDWSASIFNDDRARNLRGVVFLFMGHFGGRRCIVNPRYVPPAPEGE